MSAACRRCKDLKSARTEPLYTLVSIILPLYVLVLMSLLVVSGGLASTAAVMQESGPLAQQFYSAMQAAHSFVVQQATTGQVEAALQQGRLVAVVTVPADFDARIQRHKPVGTIRTKGAPAAPNLLNREFETEAPNSKLVSDTTSVWTTEGWLYVAAILDLFSRRASQLGNEPPQR